MEKKYEVGKKFQWIKGDNLFTIESLKEETDDSYIFESGRKIFKQVYEEYMITDESFFMPTPDSDNVNKISKNSKNKVNSNVREINDSKSKSEPKKEEAYKFFFDKIKEDKQDYQLVVDLELPNLTRISSMIDLLGLSGDEVSDVLDYLIETELTKDLIIERLKESLKLEILNESA